jgi:hypothetical protein
VPFAETVFETRAELESVIAKCEEAIERGIPSFEVDVIDSAMHAEEHLQTILPVRDTLAAAEDVQSQIQHIELKLEQLGRGSFKEKKELASSQEEGFEGYFGW